MQEAYNLGKVGVGVGIITCLSIAPVSGIAIENMTINTPIQHKYEALTTFFDNRGSICTSSDVQNTSFGDVLIDNNSMLSYMRSHRYENVKLHITGVSRHVSKFDFEEEYEEL